MDNKKIKIYGASFLGSLGSDGGFKGLFNKIVNRHDTIDKKINTIKKGKDMGREEKTLYNQLSKMKLGGSDYLVFLCLLGHLDYHNRITIKQKDIAELCRMSRPQVSRSIKKLKEVGFLEDTKELIIHFDLLFRGRSSEYENQKNQLMMQSNNFKNIVRGDNWGGDFVDRHREIERQQAQAELMDEDV
ncbi:helix-turn-helix domain-containing protein [Halomonas sabkhae]|uniref:MarR family transcriptional regulator n=1 Tax=Halomonas sabkhae TaxID=626223 RepID=UPI0025B4DD4B|nr:helix-turn-helix domain-containing protein [Halomonas sabkhae]MDN3525088.1 helix-turn-helix domain-containing protein [Halomonas sabkhae]